MLKKTLTLPSLATVFSVAGLCGAGGAGILLPGCGGSPPAGVDMGQGTTVTVPSCPTATVTADQLYTDVVKTQCALSGCHGSMNSVEFGLTSAADMKSKWVGQNAMEASIPRITAGDVNKSYVLYKLAGEQLKVATPQKAGDKMPLGTSLLPADLCKFVNWVKGGAT